MLTCQMLKAEKESNIDICMIILSEMRVSQDVLDEHSVKNTNHVALLLKKSLYGL